MRRTLSPASAQEDIMINYKTGIILEIHVPCFFNNATELLEQAPESQPVIEQLKLLPPSTPLIIRGIYGWSTNIGEFFTPLPPLIEEDIPF